MQDCFVCASQFEEGQIKTYLTFFVNADCFREKLENIKSMHRGLVKADLLQRDIMKCRKCKNLSLDPFLASRLITRQTLDMGQVLSQANLRSAHCFRI